MLQNRKWVMRKLGELAEFRNGVNYTKDNFGEGIKVIGVSNFQDFIKPKYNELEQINPNGIVSSQHTLQDGDIVFVRSNGNRELIGRSLYIEQPHERITHSAFTIRLRFVDSGVFPRFYAYYFRSPVIRQALTTQGGGTNINNLNQDILFNLSVPLPPLPIQRRIAGILSAYDDLIENCQRRIKILEEVARGLYREWFVNFRFPGHEGSRFVDSPLGRIPEGWEVTTLGTIISKLESGKRPKGGIRDVADGVPSIGAENINGIGQHDFKSEKYISREFFHDMKKGVVCDGDIAIYKDGAYIGKSSFFRDGFPHSECCVNEHVFLVRVSGDRLKQNAVYLWLQEPDTIHMIRSTNTNAAQPGINQQSINCLEIILPDSKTATCFDQIVEPMLAAIISQAKRTRSLRSTRDLLLPRLLSGQIEVEAQSS